MTDPGRLLVCATPIGNLGDASPRLREALEAADVVYAEDTRRSRTLLEHLGIRRPLVSYFAGNEQRRAEELAERLTRGETVALVTDAGTPGISDPGLSAVEAALAAGAEVSAIPGPSAVTFALAVSGLPSDRFTFEGFLPRRGADRARRLDDIVAETRTAVLFCAPGRLSGDLADLTAAGAGDRACVVVREATKLHEEVWRGTVAEAAAHWAATEARGEVTVVVGPAQAEGPSLEQAVDRAVELVRSGMSRSEAVRRTATEMGVSRRVLYERVVGDRR